MADKIVQIPNIGPVAFPESMSDAEIIKAIQTLQVPAAAPVAAQAAAGKVPESFQSKISICCFWLDFASQHPIKLRFENTINKKTKYWRCC